jgi:hypothetical protein
LGLEVAADSGVKVSLQTGVETKEQIMVQRDGYIPHTVASMAINEFFTLLDGKMGLENGAFEVLMALRIDMLKTVDQRPELQYLVEQLVFKLTNYFTDQDYDGM